MLWWWIFMLNGAPPCLKIMPAVNKLSNDYKGKVNVLKVETDGN
jgi:thiol-disulfide isomerase/thioredoxin